MSKERTPSIEVIENREGQIREVAESVRRFLKMHEASLALQRAISVTQGGGTKDHVMESNQELPSRLSNY